MRAIIKETKKEADVWKVGHKSFYHYETDRIYSLDELEPVTFYDPLLKVKPYTDEGQSRFLTYIGMDPCTADMWSERKTIPDTQPGDFYKPNFIPEFEKQHCMDERDKFFVVTRQKVGRTILPRWSFAALRELLPDEITSSYEQTYRDRPVIYYLNTEPCHGYVYRHELDEWMVDTEVPRVLLKADATTWLDSAFVLLLQLMTKDLIKSSK